MGQVDVKYPNQFIGKSKMFYVKNPVNNDKYCYARYESIEAYDSFRHLPYYVTHTEAFKDFKDCDEGYEFEITYGNERLLVTTDMEGKMADGGNFKDYLNDLYKEHGRSKVNYVLQRI